MFRGNQRWGVGGLRKDQSSQTSLGERTLVGEGEKYLGVVQGTHRPELFEVERWGREEVAQGRSARPQTGKRR